MLTYIKSLKHMNKEYKPARAKIDNVIYLLILYGGTTTINFIFALMI
jgi:hypothetical protein